MGKHPVSLTRTRNEAENKVKGSEHRRNESKSLSLTLIPFKINSRVELCASQRCTDTGNIYMGPGTISSYIYQDMECPSHLVPSHSWVTSTRFELRSHTNSIERPFQVLEPFVMKSKIRSWSTWKMQKWCDYQKPSPSARFELTHRRNRWILAERAPPAKLFAWGFLAKGNLDALCWHSDIPYNISAVSFG